MKNKQCGQMKCGFNIMGGCQKCDVCGASPNEVNSNCDRCWNCENDEGLLRWDDGDENKETQAEKVKEKEEKIKQVCYVN